MSDSEPLFPMPAVDKEVSVALRALEIIEGAFSSKFTEGVDDVGQYANGVTDGIKLGVIAAQDHELQVDELIGEIDEDFYVAIRDADYTLGALYGVLVTHKLIESVKSVGVSDV